jgi:hypothetical protein
MLSRMERMSGAGNVSYKDADSFNCPRSPWKYFDAKWRQSRMPIAGSMKLSRKVLQLAFGCHHSELSRVFTIDRRTYRVCFQCAKQIEYSWETMCCVDSNEDLADTRRHEGSGRSEVALMIR